MDNGLLFWERFHLNLKGREDWGKQVKDVDLLAKQWFLIERGCTNGK